MAPADPDRSDARDRIMQATFELVAEEGLGSVTMTPIADRADVARQTLYNHFTDVEQIVIAGIEEYNAIGFAHLTELLEATATTEAKLDLLVRHTVAATSHGHAVADLRSALSAECPSAPRSARDVVQVVDRVDHRTEVWPTDHSTSRLIRACTPFSSRDSSSRQETWRWTRTIPRRPQR